MLKKPIGLSLLEVMLVLVVMSTLVIISVRYFGTADATKKRTTAVAQMNRIYEASKAYIDAEENPSTTLISSSGSVLVDNNYLAVADMKNPWQGTIIVCWGTSDCGNNQVSTLRIAMQSVPADDCPVILNSISNSTVASLNVCDQDQGETQLVVFYQLF